MPVRFSSLSICWPWKLVLLCGKGQNVFPDNGVQPGTKLTGVSLQNLRSAPFEQSAVPRQRSLSGTHVLEKTNELPNDCNQICLLFI